MWILTLIGWSFFRSSNLGQLWNWVAALGTGTHLINLLGWSVIVVVTACCAFIIISARQWKQSDESSVKEFHWVFRGLMYAVYLS